MKLSHNPPISAATAHHASASDWLRERSRLGISLLAFLIVVVIGSAHGGYYPTAWGWSVLAFAWIAGIAFLVGGRRALSGLELAFLGALAMFIAWNALSIAWTQDIDSSVLDVQRALVYLFGVLAMLLVVRRAGVAHLLGGLVAGATWLSIQALGDRFFPDTGTAVGVIAQNRLQGALGYENAFALLGVLGALLALGLAVHGRTLPARAAAGAALPVLLTATYFTFSRGAALAAAAGLLAMIAIDRHRLALITAGALVAVPAAVAVWIASGASALTSARALPSLISDQGRELALVLVALTVASAVVAVLVGLGASRLRVPRRARRVYGALLAGLVIAGIVAVVIGQGGPGPLIDKAYSGINKDKVAATQAEANNLNSRLASVGTTGRVNYWRVAWDEHEVHPWLGSGAGTFEQFWLRDRPIGEPVRDAHNLYLETLAQLGWPGLVLLLGMLALPLAAAVRARGEPIAAVACGAYVAYLVHTGFEWDWEMPVLTLLALVCAVALFAACDDGTLAHRVVSPLLRVAAVAAAVALVAFSLVGLLGNRALADADSSRKRGDAGATEAAARSALRWAPWSAGARQQLGRAQVRLGRVEEGRRNLRKAAQRSPDDWRIWYYLGIASSGSQRERAFLEAATLNPLEDAIELLRRQGYRLPPRRPAP